MAAAAAGSRLQQYPRLTAVTAAWILLLYTLAAPASSQTTAGTPHLSNSDITQHPEYASAGSALRPQEQCGGYGGLCNATTIGVPCGDAPWSGSFCPDAYSCQRQNSTAWLCLPEPLNESNRSSSSGTEAGSPFAANDTNLSSNTSTGSSGGGGGGLLPNVEASNGVVGANDSGIATADSADNSSSPAAGGAGGGAVPVPVRNGSIVLQMTGNSAWQGLSNGGSRWLLLVLLGVLMACLM